ncbi:hypothetical protein ACFO8O_00705 [Hephaestia sp. GCM10023244]|uniref:hypothetical protein n=1 Tax=unclassified Hephaestia TaxID=2631281 RepID=UPI0020770E71|nr:hypothetical protein [Hephaestia sp. MAHUQ-44]MCM8729488.1 hypothetical protein [Hephaestia sp. MAHUQ-44]
MSRGPDAATLLTRALAAAAAADNVACAITGSDWNRWASATFTGVQHRLTLAGAFTPALDDWLTTLPERDFVLPGHLVADLTIVAMRASPDRIEADLQALTVEDW